MQSCVVIGVGPCGLATSARLLDLGNNVTLIDPHFECGRMGHHYRNVPANTTNADLVCAMRLSPSLNFECNQNARQHIGQIVMRDLDSHKCYDLGIFIDVLRDSQADVLTKVVQLHGFVTKLSFIDNHGWMVESEHNGETTKSIADAVVYACGSVPVEIGDPRIVKAHIQSGTLSRSDATADKPSDQVAGLSSHDGAIIVDHSMDLMVDTEYCKTLHSTSSIPYDTAWAVIGGSHSAMLIVMNLYESGYKNIVNIVRSDYRFMHVTPEGWTRYQGIGLKGPVGAWMKEHLSSSDGDGGQRFDGSSGIKTVRYDPSRSWYEQLSAHGVTHCVAAIGFQRDDSHLPEVTVNGVALSSSQLKQCFDNYDRVTGEISLPDVGSSDDDGGNEEVGNGSVRAKRCMGLFGGGIAFPQDYTDGGGHVEPWVGFKRSIEQTDLMAQRMRAGKQ